MVRKAPFLKCVRAAGVTLVGTMMVMVSAPAKADTLNQALVKLYNSSPDLMAARYAAEATNEVFNQVAANALPQVTSTWQTAYGRTYNEILRDTGDFTTSGSLSGGLSVSQTISPVISGGVVQTRKSVEAGWAGYDQNEQSIILSGIQAYLGVI